MSVKVLGLVWDVDFPNSIPKLIALKLADNASDQGRDIFPSIATIARMCGCSTAAVCKWLFALEHAGLVECVKRTAGGATHSTERQFNMSLLRQLAWRDEPETPGQINRRKRRKKLPPFMVLRQVTIQRPSTRPDGTPILFENAPKMVSKLVLAAIANPALEATTVHQGDSSRTVHQGDSSPATVHQGDSFEGGTIHQGGRNYLPGRHEPSVKPKTGLPPNVSIASSAGDALIPFDDLELTDDTQPNRPVRTHEGCQTLLPGSDTGIQAILQNGKAAALQAQLSDAFEGRNRLPGFTRELLRTIQGKLFVDVEPLIKRYLDEDKRKKLRGEKIKDPSAYLMTMAMEESAQRDGITVAEVAAILNAGKGRRGAALAAAVGTVAECTDQAAIDATAHRARFGEADLSLGAALEKLANGIRKTA